MRALVLLTCAVLALPVVAQERASQPEVQVPEQQSAKDLLLRCASSALTPKGRNRRQYCAGFVSGVEETLRLLHRTSESALSICPPPGISAGRLADVYVRYASRHREGLGRPASEIVQEALLDAYPCPSEHRSTE